MVLSVLSQFENVGQVGIGIAANLQRHALVVGLQAVQPTARDAFDGNLALFGQLQNFAQAAFFLHALGDFEREGLAAFGAQGFVDGVAGVEGFFHIVRFYRRGTLRISVAYFA